MDRVLNFALISNPMNWVIIFGVLYFVALLAHLAHSAASEAPIQLPAGL